MNERNLYIAVLALLEREGTVSIPQLARLLDASEEDVWEALDALVFCYDAVSIRLDLHSAYASLEQGGGERLLRLTQEETALLLDALEAQGISPDDELCKKLLKTKGFLADAGAGESGEGHAGAPRASIQMVNSGNVGGVMELVALACDDDENHLLAIEYQKEGASKAERRLVEPCAIVSEGDYRYLQAYCHKANGWRSFRTDRIKSATILDETYEPHEDMPEMLEERKEESRIAHVRFAPETALPLWPGLKKTRMEADGTVTASVPWLGGLWLPKHIVAMFGHAMPLDPPELVTATRRYAQSIA